MVAPESASMTRPRTPGRVVPLADKKILGRRRKEPPPDAEAIIRTATANGCTKVGVAMALAVNEDVLVRWLDERPDLKQAFDQGRERERASLHNALYQAAMAGAIVPALFLLKARHGYLEGSQDTQVNRVSITFNLPGAQPLNTFMVEADEKPRTERISDATVKRS
jgi:hypothetical protein